MFRNLGVHKFDFFGARINPPKGSKQEGINLMKKHLGATPRQRATCGSTLSGPLRAWVYSTRRPRAQGRRHCGPGRAQVEGLTASRLEADAALIMSGPLSPRGCAHRVRSGSGSGRDYVESHSHRTLGVWSYGCDPGITSRPCRLEQPGKLDVVDPHHRAGPVSSSPISAELQLL